MSEYTKGPWYVGMRTGSNANTVYAYNGETHHHDESICSVHGIYMHTRLDDLEESEGLANARLIASAPELLEACELALSEYPEDRDGMDWNEPTPVFIKKIRIAVAKARGEE